jgi:sugar phosphate isomerase/epimerase
MQLCCSSPMVPGATLTEKARNLKAWGFDAIGVFQQYAEWDDAVMNELTSLEEREGIRPVEFVLEGEAYGNAMSVDEDLRRQCRTMYRTAAAVAAEIGAVTEIEFQYGPQDPMPLFEPYQQLSPQQREDFIEFYREMLAIVVGSSGHVLLEPLNRYESRYLNLISDNADIVDAVQHPNAGLVPDTFHMSIEESNLGDSLRQAGDRIVHIQLGDSNRLLPGRGLLDWAEILGALADIGYDGYVSLECSTGADPERSLPQTARFLREQLARAASNA